ncbi:hypothetical protein MBAV_006162, partial [Candidatus Magnetobacterium bavaricum]
RGDGLPKDGKNRQNGDAVVVLAEVDDSGVAEGSFCACPDLLTSAAICCFSILAVSFVVAAAEVCSSPSVEVALG